MALNTLPNRLLARAILRSLTRANPSAGGGGDTQIEHFQKEFFTAEDILGTGAYKNSANLVIPNASLTAGDWIFFVHAYVACSSTSSNTNYFRLVENDGTPTVISRAYKRELVNNGLSGVGEPLHFMARATIDGGSDVVLQVQSATGITVSIAWFQVMAIKIGDLTEGTHFWYQEDTTGVADLTAATWTDVGVSLTPTSAADILLFGEIEGAAFAAREIQVAIVQNSVRTLITQGAGEDNGDTYPFMGQITVPANGGQAITMEAQIAAVSTGDVASSRLFILNLSAFADYAIGYDDTLVQIGASQTLVDTLTFTAPSGYTYAVFGAYKQVNGGTGSGNSIGLHTNIDAAGNVLVAGDPARSYYPQGSGDAAQDLSTPCYGEQVVASGEECVLSLYSQGSGINIDAERVSMAAFSWDIAVTPQPADFANVSILMNFEDGTNLGTDAVDLSSSPNTITWTATEISILQAKFGTKSLFAGTVSQLKYIGFADNANLEFGTGDFTMECEVYLTALPSTAIGVLFSKYNSTGTQRSYALQITTAGELQWQYSVDGTNNTSVLTTNANLRTDEWMHVAVSRETNVVRIFVNGIMLKESDEGSKSYNNVSADLTVCAQAWTSFNYLIEGWMDEIRVIKGEAIYTKNFSPPTEQHPTS